MSEANNPDTAHSIFHEVLSNLFPRLLGNIVKSEDNIDDLTKASKDMEKGGSRAINHDKVLTAKEKKDHHHDIVMQQQKSVGDTKGDYLRVGNDLEVKRNQLVQREALSEEKLQALKDYHEAGDEALEEHMKV